MGEGVARVAAIRAGDREVLEAVVRECLPGLLRSARAAGLDPDAAEDAVQACLVVFIRRAGEFDGRARACTWMHGILLRTVWQARRSAQREAGHESIDEVMEARFASDGTWARPPRGPVEALERGAFRRELSECLAGLPDRQRMAFSLREVEGFETPEVCKILDVTANYLGVLLFRARNHLRECLEGRGFEGSSDVAM